MIDRTAFQAKLDVTVEPIEGSDDWQIKRKVDLRREVRDARAELERLMESPMGASATDEG